MPLYMGDGQTGLDELRWHWGEAYVIECYGLGRWVAQRRDTHETLTAESPEELNGRISEDYRRKPVPRL